MKRRPVTATIAAALRAFVSGLRVMREEFRAEPLRRKAWWSPKFSVAQIRACRTNTEASLHMADAAHQVETGVRWLLRQGASDLQVNWVNIDSPANPHHAVGNFVVTACRCDDPKVRACDLRVRPRPDPVRTTRTLEDQMMERNFLEPRELGRDRLEDKA